MKQKCKLLIILFVIGQSVFAQKKLPVIKADSIAVKIKDGDNFNEHLWFISPEAKPDIYKTKIKNVHKVTFYTNRDSISFMAKPNEKYNFIILLKNKDTALTQIVYEPTYLETLKQGGKYNLYDNRPLPEFSYKLVNDSSLIDLRKRLKLDSIAGTGNEVLKVLNILHWLHNNVLHDGEHAEPSAKNWVDKIAICKKENKGLACGTLANLLNDCYLSMGFKSRQVVCLPKDSLGIDPDCHSIDVVYLNTLKKWVWIDPTNNAYVMNEKGELLGIDEVRERLINDKPLILNPDANWNNLMSRTKEEYLYDYMAKNLYMLRCYVGKEKDSQGKVIPSAIELMPLDYFEQKPDKAEDVRYGFKCIIYKTNNSNKFWETP